MSLGEGGAPLVSPENENHTWNRREALTNAHNKRKKLVSSPEDRTATTVSQVFNNNGVDENHT